jgi:oligopeptide/dipeptide ABC transporter ATP-binding protein
MSLLAAQDLRVTFPAGQGEVEAVRGVDLHLQEGETLALVGETGCGKSLTGLALLGLIPAPGRLSARRLEFAGQDLRGLNEGGWQRLRGRCIGMVFQDPGTALNPVFTVGDQMGAVLARHRGLRGRQGRRQAAEWMERVGLGEHRDILARYPHQLSGGMRQRVAIALALCAGPRLLVADEPTTALDVTVQAQILELLRRLQKDTGVALLFISHDLGVVAQTCHRLAVMYAGRIVEEGPVARVFRAPAHPYTGGLFAALPGRVPRGQPLLAIPGTVPPPGQTPAGCPFHPRCSRARPACQTEVPPLQTVRGEQRAACLFPLEEPA